MGACPCSAFPLSSPPSIQASILEQEGGGATKNGGAGGWKGPGCLGLPATELSAHSSFMCERNTLLT